MYWMTKARTIKVKERRIWVRNVLRGWYNCFHHVTHAAITSNVANLISVTNLRCADVLGTSAQTCTVRLATFSHATAYYPPTGMSVCLCVCLFTHAHRCALPQRERCRVNPRQWQRKFSAFRISWICMSIEHALAKTVIRAYKVYWSSWASATCLWLFQCYKNLQETHR